MQFFSIVGFQDLVVAFGLGLGFVILLHIALSGYRRERKEASGAELEQLMRGDLAHAHDPEGIPLPPVLIFIYLGVAIWAVAYVVVVGIRGVAF